MNNYQNTASLGHGHFFLLLLFLLFSIVNCWQYWSQILLSTLSWIKLIVLNCIIKALRCHMRREERKRVLDNTLGRIKNSSLLSLHQVPQLQKCCWWCWRGRSVVRAPAVLAGISLPVPPSVQLTVTWASCSRTSSVLFWSAGSHAQSSRSIHRNRNKNSCLKKYNWWHEIIISL